MFLLFIPFFISTFKTYGNIFVNKNIILISQSFFEFIQLKINFGAKFLDLLIIISLRIFLFLLPFIIITALELRKNRFKLTSLGRLNLSNGSRYADIWYLFIRFLVRIFPQTIVFTTLGLTLFNEGIRSIFANFYTNFLPFFDNFYSSTLSLVIVLLLSDFLKYFTHRIAHAFPLTWDLHEFHHSATEMTILCNQRGFEIEGVFTGFILIPFTVLTGLILSESISNGNLLTLFIYFFDILMQDFFSYMGHSSLKVTYPKPISYIYMSPSLHWIHHSRDTEHWDKNFGEKYAFWDKIFGTYLDEKYINDVKFFGIEGGSEYNRYHPLFSYSVVPILKIFRRTGITKLLRT